jgi:hypothetical protein
MTKPDSSALKSCCLTFTDEYCEKQYGFFRPVVDEVVEEYLRCGDLHEGFARVRCTNRDCRHLGAKDN